MKTLRSKFIFWICLLFILMGLLIFVPLSKILPEKITSQILKRDIKIAQYLSREVQEPLLTNNKLALRLLLEDRLESSSDTIYIFIRSRNGKIISSTFKKGFPKGLMNINPVRNIELPREINKISNGVNPIPANKSDSLQDLYSVGKFLTNGKKVYDIAIPLLEGELGELHLGVSLESSKAEIAEFSKINYYLAIIIFIVLGIGILIFAFLGIFLSNRIIKLRDFAARVGDGNLNDKIDIRANDEIGSLADSFNKMVENLREKIETIKRLSYLQERERIAMEFHDGIAQNLANIIKRLELLERLFRVDSQSAFLELGTLKENTKDVLHKTRQAISDLKLSQDVDFNLLNELNDYIRDYQKESNINIRLKVRGSLDGILKDKLKSIFCIIREALTNVRKHAQAKNVELSLEYSDSHELIISIKDDGKGFDVERIESSTLNLGRWGLISMHQRTTSLGGRFVIDSKPFQGTEIYVNIPL